MSEGECLWSSIWLKPGERDKIAGVVGREETGIRCARIVSYLEKYLGSAPGLKSVEVGAGSGIYSAILAKRGFDVTLLDYCEDALTLSRGNFGALGLSADFKRMDAFTLAPDLLGKFDVAMSFGTVEHYRYPEWLNLSRSHFNLVRPGGAVIISVPNSWFLPQELLRLYLQVRNKWQFGYTRGFSRRELVKLGSKLGLRNVEVYGSSFTSDISKFAQIIRESQAFKKFFKKQNNPALDRESASVFDNLFGADVFLMGIK